MLIETFRQALRWVAKNVVSKPKVISNLDLLQGRLLVSFRDGGVGRKGDRHAANYVNGELGEDWDKPGRLGIMDFPNECQFFSTICGDTVAGPVWWRILRAVS